MTDNSPKFTMKLENERCNASRSNQRIPLDQSYFSCFKDSDTKTSKTQSSGTSSSNEYLRTSKFVTASIGFCIWIRRINLTMMKSERTMKACMKNSWI